MIKSSLTDYLVERYRLVEQTDNSASFLGTRLFKMILSGDAKLPLDRVEEVANLLDCDSRHLFRMAMHQFYDKESVSMFELMLSNPLSQFEQQWLDLIRYLQSSGPKTGCSFPRSCVGVEVDPQDRCRCLLCGVAPDSKSASKCLSEANPARLQTIVAAKSAPP